MPPRYAREWEALKTYARDHNDWYALIQSCLQLGQSDSMLYYWNQKTHENPYDSLPYWIVKGNRDKVVQIMRVPKQLPDDLLGKVDSLISELYMHAWFLDGDTATRLLQQLQQQYPEYQDYGKFNNPDFDRLKSVYPQFRKEVEKLTIN